MRLQQSSNPSRLSPLQFWKFPLRTPQGWDNGCLRGGLDIVNRSAGPLFLTKMGPYFAIALDVSKDGSQSDHALEWVNIYGDTDTITSEVDSLPAGSKIHQDFCFRPTVWVVNVQRETRREIPVRGKLRVDVSYFASEQDWKTYKDLWLENESDALRLWSTAFAEIPCAKATCKPDCNRPPVGIHGESRSLTDIGQSSPGMNVRGKELTEQLSRKFPPCSGDKSTPESAFPQSTESHCPVRPLVCREPQGLAQMVPRPVSYQRLALTQLALDIVYCEWILLEIRVAWSLPSLSIVPMQIT
jgi:hypothetical protein